MLENMVNDVLYYVIWFIELIGILIIVYGVGHSLITYIKEKVKNSNSTVKLILANYLALGLEFMLASEILRTVTINREFSEIMLLGTIIVLRAAMSALIYFELSYEEKKEVIIEKRSKKNNNIKTL